MSRSVRSAGGAADVHDQVARLVAEIERDELTIKDSLVHALEKGQTGFALKILREWRTKPPREVVAKYLEADDGNSE